MNKQFGFSVLLTKKVTQGTIEIITIYNITEIHYLHKPFCDSIAFESDIHATGISLPKDSVLEFEARIDNKIHKSYWED